MNAAKAANTEPIPGYRLIDAAGQRRLRRSLDVRGARRTSSRPSSSSAAKATTSIRTTPGAEQELRALQHIKALRHPFLLSMDRVEFVDGELVIVMELADRSLHDLLDEYRAAGRPGRPRAELLGYFAEAAEVLDLLNQEHGLQHLDIKPRNLFLVGRHIKVADFGLVNSLAEMNGSAANAVLMGGVTPVYAAPESFLGKITLFSDQYSLAITYHELLVGRAAVRWARTSASWRLQHMQAEPDLSRLPEADRPVVAASVGKRSARPFSFLFRFYRGVKDERGG